MRYRIGTALLALALSASADQANMGVDAEIIGVCKIDQVTLIDFGDLEQGTTAPNRIAPGSVRYWCSLGLRYTVKVDDGVHAGAVGSRRMKGQASTNSTEYLSYDLRPRRDSGTGLGPQAPEVFEMEAEVKGTDYNVLSVGGFLDTVVVTISP
jgi:spore coat protein U-like protein